MDELLYKVIFEGDILPGKEQSDVQKELAQLFGIEVEKAARLFTGSQRKLKSSLTQEQAKKYVRALAKLGALAFIAPDGGDEEDVAPQAVQSPDSQFTQTGSFDVSAFRAYFEKKEAEKNQPESNHEILSLSDVRTTTTETGPDTQEDDASTKEEKPDSVEDEPGKQEDEPVTHEIVSTEQQDEWDEMSGIQNVISSDVLRKLIEEEKNKK